MFKCLICGVKKGSRKSIRKHITADHKIKCYKNDLLRYNKSNPNTSYESEVSEKYERVL